MTDIYLIIFSAIRILTIVPLTFLIVAQLINLLKNGKEKELLSTRLVLFFLTIAIWAEALIFLFSDFGTLFLGSARHSLLAKFQWVLSIIRVTLAIGVWKMYNLVYRK